MRRALLAPCLVALAVTAPACVVNVDNRGYIEHEEKRVDAQGVADLRLETFDGNIEVRSWDRSEIVVDIEKRGKDKAAVERIEVSMNRSGNGVELVTRYSDRQAGLDLAG